MDNGTLAHKVYTTKQQRQKTIPCSGRFNGIWWQSRRHLHGYTADNYRNKKQWIKKQQINNVLQVKMYELRMSHEFAIKFKCNTGGDEWSGGWHRRKNHAVLAILTRKLNSDNWSDWKQIWCWNEKSIGQISAQCSKNICFFLHLSSTQRESNCKRHLLRIAMLHQVWDYLLYTFCYMVSCVAIPTVDWERFKSNLCAAYYNENDEKYMFFKVLSNYALVKRHHFYHILIHHYIKLKQLKTYKSRQHRFSQQ